MGSNSSIVISFAIAILLLLILMLLLSYNSKCKTDSVERFEPNQQIEPLMNYNERFQNEINQSFKDNNEGFNNQIVDPYAPGGPLKIKDEEKVSAVGYEGFTNGVDYMQQDPTSCFKRDRLTKDDLLPKDANLKWAQINPSSAGDITDKNFLTAGYHIGIDTKGQSLRNANLQLRSEIPNPQVAVSPWLISTIEPDIRPVSFEIGSAPSY
jgi:hypothetical protein